MPEGKTPEKMDLPHSEAGHNPYWCGGDYNGQASGDDPCWGCINFFISSQDEAVKALEAANAWASNHQSVAGAKEIMNITGEALAAAGKGD